MSKKKLVTIRIIGPDCRDENRLYMPGETATVPAKFSDEWIQKGLALAVRAEVVKDD
jgi:hypothetical protein